MPLTTNLTPDQEKAIRTRDTSIALAAGAGCGKTFVLTARFLSHLEHDSELVPKVAELHQLIAITFTDAAAREMRRRIRDQCFERSVSAPTRASQDNWHKLLRAIEGARVSTIHAFCASLLRSHAIEAGLDSSFGVLEQGAADVLLSEVIDDVLRARLAKLDATTLELAGSYGLSTLKKQLRELVGSRHEPAFHEKLNVTPDELVAIWQGCHDEVALPAALEELATSPDRRTMIELLHSVTPPPTKEAFVEAKAQLLDLLPRLERGELDEPTLRSLRSYVGVQSICNAKDWPSKESFDAYRGACKRFRDALDKHTPKPFSAVAARQAAELGLKLLDLAHAVVNDYDRVKLREGKLDYDDLLSHAYRLLTDPMHDALRARLSADLRLLMVDEFQDTDRLQVALVKALCGDVTDGKLFFVGDMNQSIYRFRGAQPDVFLDLHSQIPEPGRLPLTRNFRSQPAILNFVNALFVQAFGKGYQPLEQHRAQVTAEPAIEFLWTPTPDKRRPGGKQDARRQEARRIARRLRELMESETPIIADTSADGGRRALRPGDVAILFRALSDVALYETALREYGLDYYLVGGHAFYSQQEVYDVLNLLRAVASEADEIALAGVLRSPFFSLEDETLFWLVESAGSLNDGLFGGKLPPNLSTTERHKAMAAAQTLGELRAQKDSLPITQLLDGAFAHTGYDATLLAEFLGQRKLANLHKLLEQARTADSGHVLDLAGFIAQLAEFVAREPKEALAATLSESADVIRLMTIHYAKGLEFPLVIIPDVDRPADFRAPVAALHETLGPVVKPPADESDETAITGLDLFRTLEKRADAEERKRLFYVATTRAADYLILSSSLAGYETDALESDWMRLLAQRFDLATGALRGDLPADLPPPRVRVTDEEPATDFKPLGSTRGPDLVAFVEAARDLAASGGGVVPPNAGPVAPDLAARRQFSISRLTGRLVRPDADDTEFLRQPSSDTIDPRQLGRLVHAVLERLALSERPEVATLCEQLAAERVFHQAARTAELAGEMIERFVRSPRWAAIAAAPIVHRELEFLLAWPGDGGEQRYLQGYFDCLYQDARGWHLVDYKTNDVAAKAVAREAQDYEMQMLLYALAFERAVGGPPVEIVLHFLRLGVEHTFKWNDAARERCVRLVNAAMNSLVAEATSPN